MALKPKSGLVSNNPSSPRSLPKLDPGESPFVHLTSTYRPKRQANMLIYGDSGTAKTSFCTRHAPDPIALISLDGRAEHAVHYAVNELGRDIHLLDLQLTARKLPPDQMKLAACEIVERVVGSFEWAVEKSHSGEIRTICIDTATEYSEILKLSFDGVTEQTKEGAYGKDKDYVNRQWWRLFNLARSGKAHFIVTSRAKEIWIKNDKGKQEATGRFTYRCPPVVSDAVDWAGNIRLKTGITGRVKKEFELEITKCGANLNELCEVYDAGDWDDFGGPFVYACWKQFEKTSDLSDWI